jgi:hypothetical protein
LAGEIPSDKEKKKEFYVKKEDLMRELRAYQASKAASPDHKGIISEELGIMIMKICTRFSLHPRFFRIHFQRRLRR